VAAELATQAPIPTLRRARGDAGRTSGGRAPRHRGDRTAAATHARAWDWRFPEDGALALDSHELWLEPAQRTDVSLSQARAPHRLKEGRAFATFPRMPTAGEIRRLRRARRRRTSAQRSRRTAGYAVLMIVLVGTLVLTAFGSDEVTPAPATAAQPQSALVPAGPPSAQIVAARGGLRLQLPVPQTRLTAIGYHDAGPGVLTLDPVGRRGNRGLLGRLADRVLGRSDEGLLWYQLGGGGTSALDVGAGPGTDVFSPVDGVVVGIDDLVIDGRVRGARIDIEPADAPSLVVSVTRVKPDPTLAVGSPLAAARSRLGAVLGLSHIERQSLARYTQDAGDHVTVEVRPAPTTALG
jgi:hypothetical protein